MKEKKLIVEKVREKMKEVVARGRYDQYDDPGLCCANDPGVTKQSFKDECDIEKILERGSKTGFYPVMHSQPMYGDVSQVSDYQAALDIVTTAQAQFASLDAKVRKRFDNDPSKFLSFMADADNIDEMVSLGLAVAQKPVSSASDDSGKTSSSPTSESSK